MQTVSRERTFELEIDSWVSKVPSMTKYDRGEFPFITKITRHGTIGGVRIRLMFSAEAEVEVLDVSRLRARRLLIVSWVAEGPQVQSG
jgi:hypothetical protein